MVESHEIAKIIVTACTSILPLAAKPCITKNLWVWPKLFLKNIFVQVAQGVTVKWPKSAAGKL